MTPAAPVQYLGGSSYAVHLNSRPYHFTSHSIDNSLKSHRDCNRIFSRLKKKKGFEFQGAAVKKNPFLIPQVEAVVCSFKNLV